MVGAMPLEYPGRSGPGVETCQYEMSNLAFRGPKRSLTSEYVAFLGGTETFGKFVDHPYPQRTEHATGLSCVNLGLPNAGIDVMLGDPGITQIASGARATVLQVPCAVNLSNGFYKVHPRRNDRFVRAHGPLEALYPEVDFTEFHFTRHMLAHLRGLSRARFLQLQAELAALWVDGMQRLIQKVKSPVILLWFSERRPEEQGDDPDLRYDPALVSRDMLTMLEAQVSHLVEFRAPRDLREDHESHGLAEKVFSRLERQMMRSLPGQGAHDQAAEVLIPAIADVLDP